jgi:hypothetical protein
MPVRPSQALVNSTARDLVGNRESAACVQPVPPHDDVGNQQSGQNEPEHHGE